MDFKIKTKSELEKFALRNWNTINQYLEEWQNEVPFPFYSSVDIRESAGKLAAIDHNIYPAGFNNICSLDLENSSLKLKKTIESLNPGTKTVAIIPESHTKNTFYLDHLVALKEVLEKAEYKVFFTTFDETLFPMGVNRLDLTSNSGKALSFYRSSIRNGLIALEELSDEKVDLAILNNDQSLPLPVPWTELKIPVFPSPGMGWYRRQKNIYFRHYADVCEKFAQHFEINPGLLYAKYRAVDGIDFSTKEGFEHLANEVEALKKELPPEGRIFVKPSQGTYGMGITVVNSGEEILNMNRKERNKMDIGKNHIKFTSVLLQEGVETIITYDGAPAEITIYLVGGQAIGGFMRTNSERGPLANLNSKGMVFRKFCFSEIEQDADHMQQEVIYAIISRLANLASGYEMRELLNN